MSCLPRGTSILLLFLLLCLGVATAFLGVSPPPLRRRRRQVHRQQIRHRRSNDPGERHRPFTRGTERPAGASESESESAATAPSTYGEFTVDLIRPLGIVLEEREAGEAGVQVESVVEGGSADASGAIVRGDVLLSVAGTDVSTSDFDTVMDIIIAAPDGKEISLTLSDGLGTMDIVPNLAKKLKPEEAVFADAVVRAAVREVRRSGTAQAQLGDLLRVEIVLGAGVRDTVKGRVGERCMVRFFAIFSTDTVTTYSCSVSATGVRRPDGNVEIIALSCAKDEGWGQTIDLKREGT